MQLRSSFPVLRVTLKMATGAVQILILGAVVTAGNEALRRRKFCFPAVPWRVSLNPIVSCPKSLPPSSMRPIFRPCRAGETHDQVEDSGNNHAWESSSGMVFNWAQPMLDFATTNFLPLALVSGVAFGLANPSFGCLAHRYSLSKLSTFGIFLISGLTLQSGEINAATKAWPAGMFGLCSILFFTPFFSKLMLQLHLAPQEFITGLAIFCCMPTTLSSGVALTQLVGGNSALALALTVISNLLGILIVPFSLSMLIAEGVGISVPTRELVRSLVVTLLVPLILGKILLSGLILAFLSAGFSRCLLKFLLLRDMIIVRSIFKSLKDHTHEELALKQDRVLVVGVAEFVDKNRRLFSMISAVSLSLVPWMQVSRSRSLLLMVKPIVFLAAIGMGTFLHLIFLAWNALAVQSLSVVSGGKESVFAKKENARAVIIVASQKTLPVMVAVVEQLGRAFGEPGLLVLPCVAAHINQIIFDSFLVNYWLHEDKLFNQSKEA